MGEHSDSENGKSISSRIFVIRIWREPRELPGAPKIWRGVIEQVPGGDRCYFDRLPTLIAYLISAARGTGLAVTPCFLSCLKLCQRLEPIFNGLHRQVIHR